MCVAFRLDRLTLQELLFSYGFDLNSLRSELRPYAVRLFSKPMRLVDILLDGRELQLVDGICQKSAVVAEVFKDILPFYGNAFDPLPPLSEPDKNPAEHLKRKRPVR